MDLYEHFPVVLEIQTETFSVGNTKIIAPLTLRLLHALLPSVVISRVTLLNLQSVGLSPLIMSCCTRLSTYSHLCSILFNSRNSPYTIFTSFLLVNSGTVILFSCRSTTRTPLTEEYKNISRTKLLLFLKLFYIFF